MPVAGYNCPWEVSFDYYLYPARYVNNHIGDSFSFQHILNTNSSYLHRNRARAFFFSIHIFLNEEDQHSYYSLLKNLKNKKIEQLMKEENNLFNFIEYSVSKNHYYVSKKSYKDFEKKINNMTRFISIFKRDLSNIKIEKVEDKTFYDCELFFIYPSYRVSLEFESSGIKRLVKLYDCLNAAENGEIVFIDEMDANINSVYLKKLIDYFIRYGEGQICMNLHALEPMEVLKKNKLSIDFLTPDGIKTWNSHGNANPENFYRFGMIEGIPLNIEAEDFLGIFGNYEEGSDG